MPQLFDAFSPSRADETGREHEGLGFFITREIAGAQFRVRLPREPAAARLSGRS